MTDESFENEPESELAYWKCRVARLEIVVCELLVKNERLRGELQMLVYPRSGHASAPMDFHKGLMEAGCIESAQVQKGDVKYTDYPAYEATSFKSVLCQPTEAGAGDGTRGLRTPSTGSNSQTFKCSIEQSSPRESVCTRENPGP